MLHGACAGEEAGAQNLVFFPCKVAAGGDEGQLVCEAVAGTLVLMFLILPWSVLHFARLRVCVVLCACGIPGCRSHWNGWMNVLMFCCHVRRDMRVIHVMLLNAV